MGGVFWLITGKVVFYTVNDEMNEFLICFALVTKFPDFFEEGCNPFLPVRASENMVAVFFCSSAGGTVMVVVFLVLVNSFSCW